MATKKQIDDGDFSIPGTDEAIERAAATYSVDLIVRMIADRIRDGEDPKNAAKAVLDLAKEFAESDDVIFDDDDGVSVEGEREEKNDAD